jgi:hypothetical protein
MKRPLSPCDIDVLIWYHVHPHVHPNADAPAVRESTAMWVRCGMLERAIDGIFTTSLKGSAMIRAWCRTQEPEQIWVSKYEVPS